MKAVVASGPRFDDLGLTVAFDGVGEFGNEYHFSDKDLGDYS